MSRKVIEISIRSRGAFYKEASRSKPIVAGGELLDFKDRGQRRKL